MRFLADENVSRYVVERLRAAGFDVTGMGLTNPMLLPCGWGAVRSYPDSVAGQGERLRVGYM